MNGCELKKDMFIKNLTMKRLLSILGIIVLFLGSSCIDDNHSGLAGIPRMIERELVRGDSLHFYKKQNSRLKKALSNKEKKIQKTEYYKYKAKRKLERQPIKNTFYIIILCVWVLWFLNKFFKWVD